VCPLALSSGDETVVNNQIAKLALADILILAPDLLSLHSDHSLIQRPQSAKPVHEFSESEFQHIVSVLTNIFAKGGKAFPILQQLRNLQQHSDPKGIHGLFEASDSEGTTTILPRATTSKEEMDALSMAMTLRDTTMFVKLSLTDNVIHDIDARLADLDPKSGGDQDRLRKWWQDEDRLIREGYYAGEEGLVGSQQRHTACLLWNTAVVSVVS
jgi:hypothetical protein